MDMGLFRGLLTAVLLLLFIGVCWRSFSRKRSTEYHEAEQLPLEEGDRPPGRQSGQQSSGEGIHE
jgi:cytochrome c oxidase cbb3-type subunit 4